MNYCICVPVLILKILLLLLLQLVFDSRILSSGTVGLRVNVWVLLRPSAPSHVESIKSSNKGKARYVSLEDIADEI